MSKDLRITFPFRRGFSGLIITEGILLLIPLILNGLIFTLGWNDRSGGVETSPLAPPDGVIAGIWIALFLCMGFVYWHAAGQRNNKQSIGILCLLSACSAYPFYTAGLSSSLAAFLGSAGTLALSAYVFTLFKRTQSYRWLLIPVIIWLLFASYLTASVL